MGWISDLSAKEKGEKKLFGFSFVPLMQDDGRTLPDGNHELIVHKVRCECVKKYSVFLSYGIRTVLEEWIVAHLLNVSLM